MTDTENRIYLSFAMERARRKRAFAGCRETVQLWRLPKRELVELALRLTRADNVDDAVACAKEELESLRANGIL